MSPLACSLLAFATLLAAADAIMPNPCRTKKYDDRILPRHVKLPRIYFAPGGGLITVTARHNMCGGIRAKPVIYKVTACTQAGGYAPLIYKVDEYSFHIKCTDGCDNGGYVDIIENCYINV